MIDENIGVVVLFVWYKLLLGLLIKMMVISWGFDMGVILVKIFMYFLL